jgi:hypothetical protein
MAGAPNLHPRASLFSVQQQYTADRSTDDWVHGSEPAALTLLRRVDAIRGIVGDARPRGLPQLVLPESYDGSTNLVRARARLFWLLPYRFPPSRER